MPDSELARLIEAGVIVQYEPNDTETGSEYFDHPAGRYFLEAALDVGKLALPKALAEQAIETRGQSAAEADGVDVNSFEAPALAQLARLEAEDARTELELLFPEQLGEVDG